MKKLNELGLNKNLASRGIVSEAFLMRGISTYQQAVEYVHQLPYGRNSERKNVLSVLQEGKGSCSTKHVLLKQLADEQQISVVLNMGIFLMNRDNQPTIDAVLKTYNIEEIPEAHCYLQYDGVRFDVTFPDKVVYPQPVDFIQECEVDTQEVTHHKRRFHQNFIKEWIKTHNIGKSLAHIWQCREICINSLSDSKVNL